MRIRREVSHMKRSLPTVLALACVLAGVAEAKGPFQAQGRISNVERQGDVVTFRFAGNIQFSYVTAPASNPARQAKALEFSAVDVPMQLRNWTRAFKPAEKGDPREADAAFARLVEMAKSGRAIRLSIDNPAFSFSNQSELTAVSGTHVYAHDPGQARPEER